MNGPEHYAEAERIIAVIRALPVPDPKTVTNEDAMVMAQATLSLAAQAQVHATLALAAATCHPTSPSSPLLPAPLPNPGHP